MAQYGKVIMDFLTAPVLLFQLALCGFIIEYPINRTIYSILYIMLLSSVISVVEVGFVSSNAAIIILIFWIVIIVTIADVHKEEIYNVDIVVSNRIGTLIEITFILNLVYTLFCIIYSFVSLSYL
jgi:hypothetical protein